MDFIFFKFIYNKRGRNLLIRRDDVSLTYLRKQTRQLYRIDEDTKFALSCEILKEGEESLSPQRRHYYCQHPEKMQDTFSPTKGGLLISNKQLEFIRLGKRKKHADTKILVTVHTDNDFHNSASPQTIRKAFKERKEKRGSTSSRRNSSRLRNSTDIKTLRDIYLNPIRIIKLKVDNTYDYKLPPFYMEAFLQFMLESDEGIQKLLDIHEKYPLKRKSAYNVMDYINSMDYVVRSMEIALGLQHGGRHHVLQKSKEKKPSRDNSITVSPSNKNPLDENQGESKINVEVEEVSNCSDDVFANNPSNLMLAKVKVTKKPQSEPPEPTTCCCDCKNCKCFPLKQSPKEYDSHMHFTNNGNLIPHQTLLNSNDYGIKERLADTSPSISKYQLKQMNSSTLDRTTVKGYKNKLNYDTNHIRIKEIERRNVPKQCCIDLKDRRESEHSSKDSFIINKSYKNEKLLSNTSICSKDNSSMKPLKNKQQKYQNMLPIRHEEKRKRASDIEEYQKYNDKYIRGIYTEKMSTSDVGQTSPNDNLKISRNFKTQSKDRGESNPQYSDHYGNFGDFNIR